MLTFAILNVFLVYLYCNTYLGVDGEEMGQYDLLTEGLANSAAFFLVRTFDSISVGDLTGTTNLIISVLFVFAQIFWICSNSIFQF